MNECLTVPMTHFAYTHACFFIQYNTKILIQRLDLKNNHNDNYLLIWNFYCHLVNSLKEKRKTMISFRFIVQCIFLFIGNVGPPLPCCEIKLADVEDMNYYAKDNKGEVHSNHTYDAVLGPIQENPPKCKGGGGGISRRFYQHMKQWKQSF